MSLVLNGNPNNVTTPLQATITAFANNGSGAIRVTTAAPHLFGPNDWVSILTTLFTWTFQITVIDSTHFDLIGSTFTSTSTGTATDEALTPQVLVPTDGDTFSLQLSGMLSALQACLDRDQFLAHQIQAVATPQGDAYTFTSSLTTSTVHAVGNGPPAQINTTAPHGIKTGMWVNIAGATGDTAINGNWPVNVSTTTSFTIPVTGSGAYNADTATVTPCIPPGVTAIIVDGWGGGGGGEQGGGYQTLEDSSSVNIGPYVAGGGGGGAPRRVSTFKVSALDTFTIAVGAGGAGGSGATAYPAAQAGDGHQTVLTMGSGPVVNCAGGCGAGAQQPAYPLGFPGQSSFSYDAIVAPGGSSGGFHGAGREWSHLCGESPGIVAMGYSASATTSNIYNFIDLGPAAGGAAVLPYTSGGGAAYPSVPSTGGVGQGNFTGGLAGARGTDSGSAPLYLGGPGGGGGGAGPGGGGGNGGAGSNANHSGNSSTGGNAPTAFATGGTGAGGGGGGSAGAASGTTGHGGTGAAGDSGQMTLYWVK